MIHVKTGPQIGVCIPLHTVFADTVTNASKETLYGERSRFICSYLDHFCIETAFLFAYFIFLFFLFGLVCFHFVNRFWTVEIPPQAPVYYFKRCLFPLDFEWDIVSRSPLGVYLCALSCVQLVPTTTFMSVLLYRQLATGEIVTSSPSMGGDVGTPRPLA